MDHLFHIAALHAPLSCVNRDQLAKYTFSGHAMWYNHGPLPPQVTKQVEQHLVGKLTMRIVRIQCSFIMPLAVYAAIGDKTAPLPWSTFVKCSAEMVGTRDTREYHAPSRVSRLFVHWMVTVMRDE